MWCSAGEILRLDVEKTHNYLTLDGAVYYVWLKRVKERKRLGMTKEVLVGVCTQSIRFIFYYMRCGRRSEL